MKSTYLPVNLKMLTNWLDGLALPFADSLTISRNMKNAKRPTVNSEPLNDEREKYFRILFKIFGVFEPSWLKQEEVKP